MAEGEKEEGGGAKGKWIVLIVGSLLILGLGFVAGVVILSGGSLPAEPGGGAEKGKVAAETKGGKGFGLKSFGAYGQSYVLEQQTNGDDFVHDRSAEASHQVFEKIDTAGEHVLPPFLGHMLSYATAYGQLETQSAVSSTYEHASDKAIDTLNGEGSEGEAGAAEAKGGKNEEGGATSSRQDNNQNGAAAAAVESNRNDPTGDADSRGYSGSLKTAEAGAATTWTLKFGRFVLPYNAQMFSAALQRQGIDAMVQPEIGSDGRRWYSVQSGPYPNERSADLQAGRLKGEGFVATPVGQTGGG
jgi:hypothetical protein